MKRLFFIITLVACLASISSFATETNSPDVLRRFYDTFKNAQNVSWTEVDDMLRIGFTLNGQQQFAYYCDNELVVVATEIQSQELPKTLKTQLSKYNGYIVTQVYELNKDNVKEYCIVMDSPSKHVVLKGRTKWRVYLEQKK
jgi:hypothetical protein